MPVTPALDMEAGGFSRPHTHSRSAASLGYGVLSGTFYLLEKRTFKHVSPASACSAPGELVSLGVGGDTGNTGFQLA